MKRQGMEKMIKQTIGKAAVIGNYISGGEFDIRGPDGRCLVPQIWESSVKPGITLTMRSIILSDMDCINIEKMKERYRRTKDQSSTLSLR